MYQQNGGKDTLKLRSSHIPMNIIKLRRPTDTQEQPKTSTRLTEPHEVIPYSMPTDQSLSIKELVH
jgi:hypothetical protein